MMSQEQRLGQLPVSILPSDSREIYEWTLGLLDRTVPLDEIKRAYDWEEGRLTGYWNTFAQHGLMEAIGLNAVNIIGGFAALGMHPVPSPAREMGVLPRLWPNWTDDLVPAPSNSLWAVDERSILFAADSRHPSSLRDHEPLDLRDAKLYGVAPSVQWGADGEAVLTAVPTYKGNGPALVIADLSDEGARATSIPSWDTCSRPARLDFDGVSAHVLSKGEDAVRAIEELRESMRLSVASEMLGCMNGALALALDHARIREQFERPIGSFQAVQHLLVDMWSVVYALAASCSAAATSPSNARWPRSGNLGGTTAKALASEVARDCVETAIQVLGGVGFTEEFDAGLYLKRLLTLEATWGEQDDLLEAVGRASARGR